MATTVHSDRGARVHPLLQWMEREDAGRGLRILGADRNWHFHSYASLAANTRAIAGRLEAHGVRPGDVVTLVLGTGVAFAASFFAVLAVGGVASPVAPPLVFQDRHSYSRHLARVLTIAGPRTVVTSPDLLPRLDPAEIDAIVPATTIVTDDDVRADARGATSTTAELHGPTGQAIVQFTSGSSGAPKGVAISTAALAANVVAIRRWLQMGPDDPTATWLPVHHDMGLIGCMVTPVVNGSDLWIMQPEEFVRSPARWLSCFGQHGARLTALPNFGLEHVVRRVRPEALDGFDFSGWRVAILGAERIQLDAMQAFHERLSPHGFRWETFLPAYGLAEATLAVTGVPPGRGARSVLVNRSRLRIGDRVELLAAPEAAADASALSLVGCGAPLEDAPVRIVDLDGVEVSENTLGEIVVSSPSLADGYRDEHGTGASNAFVAGALRTGDAGFVRDDDLFVIGRLGDSIKVRGRTLFAEDLEDLAVRSGGLKSGRIVVLLGSLDGEDTVVVVVEGLSEESVDAVLAALETRTEDRPVIVAVGPRGCVLRTSSGKPRRRVMWDAFAGGTLDVDVVRDTRQRRQDPVSRQS